MAAQKLSKEENIFSGLLSKELKIYLDNDFPADFINNFCEELNGKVNSKSREKFYSTYYSHVIYNESVQMTNIKTKYLRVLLIKLGDLLWINLDKNKHDFSEQIRDQSVTEKEMHGLQYLGGYVFHNLCRKLKNSKNWKSEDHQQAISILEAGRGPSTDNLLSALSRGGLWQISQPVQKLLLLTEKYFRLKTKDESQRCLHTKQIVKDLMDFSFIKEFFSEVVAKSDMSPSDEVCKSTLFSILTLYIRVRSFSYTKDIVQKQRLSKSKGTKKALRKELHRTTENNEDR